MTRTTKPPQRGLIFRPGNHSYTLDGAWVPGVTSILGVLDKPALRKWAASQVAEWVADNPDAVDNLREMGRNPMVYALKEIPWETTKRAADRGTQFHEYAERILRGETVEVPPKQEALVESALRFMDEYDIEPSLVEAVVGSREHRYAGKADLIANDAIWDWKSGKRIYASAAFQLVAYAFAEFHGEGGDEKPLPPVKAAWGVHIREDDYDVVPLEFGRHVFDEFLTIRAAFDINKRAEGDWKTPGTGYVGLPLTGAVA